MKNFYSIILALFLIAGISNVNAQISTNEADSLAMYDFYNSTIENGSWSETWGNKDVAISNWDGVVTDTIDNVIYVTEISTEALYKITSDNDTITPCGKIPESIGDFAKLKVLKLIGVEESTNSETGAYTPELIIDLHGSIPSTMWNLSTLTKIQIKFTHITGGLPEITEAQAAALTDLSEINFQKSYLGGSFPENLFKLSALTKPYLHESGFTGEVPSTLTELSGLKRLYLQGNELTGDLPYSDNMWDTGESKVQLTGNYFSPASMAKYANSTVITKLTNSYQFAQDTTVLMLSSGGSVTLEDSLSNVTSDGYVWFKGISPLDATSGFSPISGASGATYTVSAAGTYTCLAYPSLCADLAYYAVFVVKDASNQTYTMNEADSLAMYDFYNNTIQKGSWSDTWGNNNVAIAKWDGVVTDTVISATSDVNTIYVTEISTEALYKITSDNDTITPCGEIPESIGNFAKLKVLKLIGVEESTDSETGAYTPELIIDLHGSIPSTMWNLSTLTKIQIKFTHLTGGLPDITEAQAAALTDLSEINFQKSYLGGSFPENLFKLPGLTKPYLHESGFTGEVPSTLTELSGLKRLYLQGNELTGDLPYSDDMWNTGESKVQLTGNYFSPASMAKYVKSSVITKLTNEYQFAQDTTVLTLTNGGTVTLEDSLSNVTSDGYVWFKGVSPLDATSGFSPISGAESASYTVSAAGTYTCLAYPSLCADLPYYAVFIVLGAGNSTGIKDVDGSAMSVVPNPFGSYINVDTESEIKNVAIYNCVGKLVYQGVYEGTNSATIETSNFVNGVYIVKITMEDKIVTKKMLKH